MPTAPPAARLETPATSGETPWISQLLQSGIIFSALSFLAGLGNYAFQAVVGRRLTSPEFGVILTTLSFVGFLGLPLAVASQAVTHYIARFNFAGQDAQMDGLLAGCRRFLFRLTLMGSVAAIVLVRPLSLYFHFRPSLTLVALICVLAGLWSAYATALCQGLGWFKRLAVIALLTAVLRTLFGWGATSFWPVAEMGVLASAVMLLANLSLLFWKREFPRRTDAAVSPWTAEFVHYLIISAASVLGSYFFSQGDLLVAQHNFGETSGIGAYPSAGLFARALPMVAGPLLVVLFTHRSGHGHSSAMKEQLKLLGLYAAGLTFGAVTLYLSRNLCLQLVLGHPLPEAAILIGRLATSMVLVGLLQALGTWALASRWIKLTIFYGCLGVAYWLLLFKFGKSLEALVNIMPVFTAAAFALFFPAWLITMRRSQIAG